MGTRATAAEIDAFMRDNDCQPAKRAARSTLPPMDILDEPYVCVTIPIKTKNPNNKIHGHWSASHRTTKEQKAATVLALTGVLDSTWAALSAGCVVTLTRASPRTLDDDALQPTLKHIRDVIAMKLFGGDVGRRDDDPRATWECRQLQCGRGEFGVVVSVRKRT